MTKLFFQLWVLHDDNGLVWTMIGFFNTYEQAHGYLANMTEVVEYKILKVKEKS